MSLAYFLFTVPNKHITAKVKTDSINKIRNNTILICFSGHALTFYRRYPQCEMKVKMMVNVESFVSIIKSNDKMKNMSTLGTLWLC